jgi:hypothetical protein
MPNKTAEQQLHIDYKQVFGTEQGQRVLEDILAYCHVLEPLTGSIETNAVLIREGRRDAGMTILQKLNWNEKNFIETAEGAKQ